MASVTLTLPDRFPPFTTVSVYRRSDQGGSDPLPDQAPSGSAVTSAQVDDEARLTFNGLAGNTRYVAYALVNGKHRLLSFSTESELQVAPVTSVLSADMAAITASTTLVDITGLGVEIGASATEIWLLKYWLLVSAANNVMDSKFLVTVPAAATTRFGGLVGGSGTPSGWGAATAATSVGTLATTGAVSVGTAGGGITGVGIVAMVFGGGTAGTAQIQVAQQTSDAGALQILRGSAVEALKLAG